MTTLTLKDGRVFVGMVRDRSGDAFKVQTMADTIPLSKPDVLQEETSSASLMPPGLLDGLATDEARDLVAYLMTK